MRPPVLVPRQIELGAHPGPSGTGVLHVLEATQRLPFPVERVFTVSGMLAGARRGGHANWIVSECVVCVQGALEVQLMSVAGEATFRLTAPSSGVLVPPGTWIDLVALEDGTAYVVLADHTYEQAAPQYEWDRNRVHRGQIVGAQTSATQEQR